MSSTTEARPAHQDPREPLPGETVELFTDPAQPPVGPLQKPKWTPSKVVLWIIIGLIGIIGIIGATGWSMVALVRGDHVTAVWFVAAAVGTFFIGYRFYSKFIERKLLRLDDRRATPSIPETDRSNRRTPVAITA